MQIKRYLFKTIIGQVIIDLVVSMFFYFILPTIMNYADHSIKYNFVGEYQGMSYFTQAVSMFILYIVLMIVFLLVYLKELIIYGNYTLNELDENIKKKISLKFFNIPIAGYIAKIICIPIVSLFVLFMANIPKLIIIKLIILLTVFFLLDATIMYTYMKQIFKGLLKESNYNNVLGKRITVRTELFIQFISIVLSSLIFISFLGYSRIIEETGNKVYEMTNSLLADYFEEKEFINIEEKAVLNDLKDLFNNTGYTIFCINPNSDVITLDDKKVPDYAIFHTYKMIHMYDILKDNRISDVSKESQGVIKVIETPKGKYIFGLYYNIIPLTTVKYFIYTIMVMVSMNIVIIIYYSLNISKNVSEVSEAIEKVVSGDDIDYNKKLSVISNDELGDLVVAFNKILDLEKQNISKMERNQEILLEQERLSSLGQLIGGIAHNLKTPIMSIAGALEGLTDLVKEYDESIEDTNVTHEDHHAIAGDMKVWVDKIRPYLSYMTEVIDTVKGQAVSMNASTMKHFNAKELVSRIKILLRDELKRKNCTLNMDLQVDENSFVIGEISAIIQVIDNLIINAIDSYNGNGGNIDLKVYEDEDKIHIEVKDYGCGIPEHVKERLFNEMITSKGKNGTGLGLYMSYSTIKGKFNGDMRYESEEGKGTTFFIELNKEKS